MHHAGIPSYRDCGDIDLVVAETNVAAISGEGLVAEAASIVADEAQRAEPLDKARDHALAGGNDGSRPDEDSSQRHCWPHGGP